MNWAHRIGLVSSILFYLFGFVTLHQALIGSSQIYLWFFTIPVDIVAIADYGFFFIGIGFVLQLVLYFTKQKDQIISIGATQTTNAKTPMNLQLSNNQLVEAILIIRPLKHGRQPKIHLATRGTTEVPITPEVLQILRQANATEMVSVELQQQ
jgi:hypothetical protein